MSFPHNAILSTVLCFDQRIYFYRMLDYRYYFLFYNMDFTSNLSRTECNQRNKKRKECLFKS